MDRKEAIESVIAHLNKKILDGENPDGFYTELKAILERGQTAEGADE